MGRTPLVNPAAEAKVLIADLFDGLTIAYRNNGLRSLATLEYRLLPLRAAFGRDRASDVTAAWIEDYKAERVAENRRPATVNRELAALRRAFRLAIEQERISHAPRIKLLEEHNTREGFLDPEAFENVVAGLPLYLQDVARFAYLSGWRRGEVQRLAWADVDRGAGLISSTEPAPP